MVVLNVLGCWSFITPKMLGLLFKAFYSRISMCAEDSSSLALVLAHAALMYVRTVYIPDVENSKL